MNPKTETALQDSIAHWQRMHDEPFEPESPNSGACALCTRFSGPRQCEISLGLDTEECPVRTKTGQIGCNRTPYADAWVAWDKLHQGAISVTEEIELRRKWEQAAQAEITFLLSLLPTAGKKGADQ